MKKYLSFSEKKKKRFTKVLVIIPSAITLLLLGFIGLHFFQSHKTQTILKPQAQTIPAVVQKLPMQTIPDDVDLDKFPEDFKGVALKDLSDKDNDGDQGPGIVGFPYDLNGDGVNEWIITGRNHGGSGGQSNYIYFKKNDKWIQIGETWGGTPEFGPSKTKGFYDIFVRVRSYNNEKGREKKCGGMTYDLYKHTWNGDEYKKIQIGEDCG